MNLSLFFVINLGFFVFIIFWVFTEIVVTTSKGNRDFRQFIRLRMSQIRIDCNFAEKDYNQRNDYYFWKTLMFKESNKM